MRDMGKAGDEKSRYFQIWRECIDSRFITWELLCGETEYILRKWDGTTWGGIHQYETIERIPTSLSDEEIKRIIKSYTKVE